MISGPNENAQKANISVNPDLVSNGKQTGGSIHGKRANIARLVLGYIVTDFCSQMLVGLMDLH